jgi:predicted negative regulator of RcsB-dependent stress response
LKYKKGRNFIMTDETTPSTPQEPTVVPVDELQQVKDWLKEHGRSTLTLLTIAVAVFLAITWFKNRKAARIAKADQVLFMAESPVDLENLTRDYDSTPAAPLALIRMGKMYYDSGDATKASAAYDRFISTYPDHPMKPVAELGRIHCLEAALQIEQAMGAFGTFAETYKDHWLAPLALLGKGRCLEQLERFKEARVVYDDFRAANPDSPWARKAETALERIEKKLGESGS